MKINSNSFIGMMCIIAGITIIVFALGDLLLRISVGLMALSLINYGLRLRNLPTIQRILQVMIRHGHFY